jgi:hypothetical protein
MLLNLPAKVTADVTGTSGDTLPSFGTFKVAETAKRFRIEPANRRKNSRRR